MLTSRKRCVKLPELKIFMLKYNVSVLIFFFYIFPASDGGFPMFRHNLQWSHSSRNHNSDLFIPFNDFTADKLLVISFI